MDTEPPDLAACVDALVARLGPQRVRTGGLELDVYRRDAGTATGRAGAVCFPESTADVATIVRTAHEHRVPYVARGSGTGLAGGATPLADAVLVVLTRMNQVLEVDPAARVAWVQPGVLNLDLTRDVAHLGLHYAPDPSSQQACTIGGNVGTNAGGPHCLAAGVTSAHVLAVEVVLPDGTVELLGGLGPDTPGLDLRGAFVGSEGTMGIATRIAVRLMPDPPEVRTLLADFTAIDHAASAVSAVIAAGIVPAAMEMMDARATRAVEDFVGAGLPRDADAVLLVKVAGLPAGTADAAATIDRICRAEGARSVRVAADAAERATLWKARKSAFGAVARIAPDYYLHDAVVPRTKLVEVVRAVYEITDRHRLVCMNVFHAGDGNLHPLLVFDGREPGVWDRVHAAGDEILRACIAAGGVLSGEHGIGIEKRDAMPLFFSADDLDAQARLRDAFDPEGLANPDKVLPRGSRCGELGAIPAGAWV
ncbi:MAG: FAD-linked oxidase C-terminal domain-containing protein [Acidimicrobiia bacterium]